MLHNGTLSAESKCTKICVLTPLWQDLTSIVSSVRVLERHSGGSDCSRHVIWCVLIHYRKPVALTAELHSEQDQYFRAFPKKVLPIQKSAGFVQKSLWVSLNLALIVESCPV